MPHFNPSQLLSIPIKGITPGSRPDVRVKGALPSICVIVPRTAFNLVGGNYVAKTATPFDPVAKFINDIFVSQNPQNKSLLVFLDDAFGSERSHGVSTGFMVAPDVIMTAGHCCLLEDKTEIDWALTYAVFDFKVNANGSLDPIPPQNVRVIERILKFAVNSAVSTVHNEIDFALLKLAPVSGSNAPKRPPFTLRPTAPPLLQALTTVPPTNPSSVWTIGHPWGSPAKYVDGGALYKLPPAESAKPIYKQAALNTSLSIYSGQSGSPVFDQSTPPQVVGIVRSGDNFRGAANPNHRKGFELITRRPPATPPGFLSFAFGPPKPPVDIPMYIQPIEWEVQDLATAIASAAQRVDWLRPLLIDPALNTTTVSIMLVIEPRPGVPDAKWKAWKLAGNLLMSLNGGLPSAPNATQKDVWKAGPSGGFVVNTNLPHTFNLTAGLARAGVMGTMPAAYTKVTMWKQSPAVWSAEDIATIAPQIVVIVKDNSDKECYVNLGPLVIGAGAVAGQAGWSIDIPHRLPHDTVHCPF